jgi:plastocyanin
MVKRTLSIGLAVAALAVSACGGSDEPAASTAPQAPAGGAAVTIGDNSYTPASVKVAVGDKVTFENGGAIAHTVTGDGFDSGSIAPGDSFELTAEKAGTLSYVCTFHPGMQGTIEVG